MAKMNVSRERFAEFVMASRVKTPEGVRVDPEKLSRISGIKVNSAKLRLTQWRKKFSDAGVKCPFPPAISEGRGAKKLDLNVLAAICAEFDDLEDPQDEGVDDFDEGDE